MNYPRTGTRWKSAQRQVFEVVAVANVAEVTPETVPPTVVYENIMDGTIWTLPAEEWSKFMTPTSIQ